MLSLLYSVYTLFHFLLCVPLEIVEYQLVVVIPEHLVRFDVAVFFDESGEFLALLVAFSPQRLKEPLARNVDSASDLVQEHEPIGRLDQCP